jgi:hypothetical protein
MNKFSEHLRNTILGFIVGIPLLDFIGPRPSWIISGIQCLFFPVYYTLLDRLFQRFKKFLKNKFRRVDRGI